MRQPSEADIGEITSLGTIEDKLLQSKILVVDDMALMRQMIGLVLSKANFTNVVYASDGDEALETIKSEQPDIVVLDLNMPRMNGYDVCRALRASEETARLPVLVQSASEAPEERVEVFEAGATDFVSKPINQQELIARVRMHLENKLLIQDLQGFERHMRRELVLARDMQLSLLPSEDDQATFSEQYGFSMEAVYRASFELGGDLWGAWRVDDTRFGVFVLDMTGHGVGSALNTFRAHATMARIRDERADPAAFLSKLNEQLQPVMALGQFCTMFYGVIDTVTDSITYAGAGAPRPIISNGKTMRTLDSSGMPVGISDNPGYENLQDQLVPGESLFCYSDVLLEATLEDGSFLGEDGLIGLVGDAAGASKPGKLVSSVLDLFFERHPGELEDDLTAVGIFRKPKTKGAGA